MLPLGTLLNTVLAILATVTRQEKEKESELERKN